MPNIIRAYVPSSEREIERESRENGSFDQVNRQNLRNTPKTLYRLNILCLTRAIPCPLNMHVLHSMAIFALKNKNKNKKQNQLSYFIIILR